MSATPARRWRREYHPAGYAGVQTATLKLMAQHVRDQQDDPRIRARVRWLFSDLDSMDYDAELQRAFEWCCNSIRYLRDPEGGEHLTEPVELDLEIDDEAAGEDCESIVTYAATLLAAAGYTSEFDLMELDDDRPGELSHAALMVEHPRRSATGERRLVSFDPVGFHFMRRRGLEFGLGDTLARPGKRRERWSLDGERVDTSMSGRFSGAELRDDFGDARQPDPASTAIDILNGISKGVSAIGPYGAIIGGLTGLAAGITGAATGKGFTPAPAPIPVAPPPPPPGYRYDEGGRLVPVSTQAPAYDPKTGQQMPLSQAAAQAQPAATTVSTPVLVGGGIAAALLLKALL